MTAPSRYLKDSTSRANSLRTSGGDTNRSFSAKNAEELNVLDYAAVSFQIGETPVSAQTGLAAAFAAANATGNRDIIFPGGPGTRYGITAQLAVTASNIRLRAPGGAKLYLMNTISLPLAIGNIDTGVTLNQANTLASNAAAGALQIALTAGKGANITAGRWYVIISDAVVPYHDGAVTNRAAEFIQVFSKSTDTLTLSRPLRFAYTTANNAEVLAVDWIEGFEIDGLGIDGADQTVCPQAICASWCFEPRFLNMECPDLEQRGIRVQGCKDPFIRNYRQSNGKSQDFFGEAGSKFSYAISQNGLVEGLDAAGVVVRGVRHAHTTGATVITNAAVTSTTVEDFGVPMDWTVNGEASDCRGSGWDTHEVGLNGHFRDCKVNGGVYHGFAVRAPKTRVTNPHAEDCVGAPVFIGAEASYCKVENLSHERCSLGTDTSTSTDWSKKGPVVDYSTQSTIGPVNDNILDNGNFDIWQHGTSTTATGPTANRWRLVLGSGAAGTATRESHATTANRQNSRRKHYLRFDRTTTGSASTFVMQYLDDVRQFEGETVTISFDMRAETLNTELNVFVRQYFGTGGSPSTDVDTTAKAVQVTTEFLRYSVVVDVPAITSKTVGSNEDSALILVFEMPTAAGAVFFDIDRVKMEPGRVPTSFVPREQAVEEERCRRWFEASYNTDITPGAGSTVGCVQMSDSVASSNYYRRSVQFRTMKGRTPTIVQYSTQNGTAGKVYNVNATADVDAVAAQFIGHGGFVGGLNSSGDVTGGDVVRFQWTAAVANFE